MPSKVLREIISYFFPLDQFDTITTVADSVMTRMFSEDEDEDKNEDDDDDGYGNQIEDEVKENAPV